MIASGPPIASGAGASGGRSGQVRRASWRARIGVRVAPAALTLAVVVALSSGAATAAITHEPLFQLGEIPAEGPHGEPIAFPGPLGKMESMTIDAGRLWVAEGSPFKPSRVDEFDAKTGAFLGQPISLPTTPKAEEKLSTCFGEGCGGGIAIGHSSGEAEVYVAGEGHGVSGVSVFDEAGSLKSTWTGAGAPGGSFYIREENSGRKAGTVEAIAVDNSASPLDAGAGDVYVALNNRFFTGQPSGEHHVVDVFHPETSGEERYVGQITGTSPSEPFKFIVGVSVEPSGDVIVDDFNFTISGNVVNIVGSSLDVFEPTVAPGGFTFVGKLAGPPPSGAFDRVETLATDLGTGELYAADYTRDGYRVEQFSSEGVYLGHIDDIPDAFSLAVDPSSGDLYARNVVYGPDVVIPDVTTAAVSELRPESAMLNGMVNPDGAGGATCEFEWGTSSALGNTTPCTATVPDGGTPVAVHALLTGLERDQTYYYRLRASNANGTNVGERWQTMSFSTHGAVLREEFVTNVSSSSATFGAKIDPGSTPTSYYFQYGPSAGYGQEMPLAPGEAIGSGATDVIVPTQHVRELTASTTYHYRAVAISEIAPNQFETLHGPDRTFTTQAAGGAFSLSDARQWELVSPPDKLGAPIQGLREGVVQASADGGAIAYRAGAPTEGEPQGFAVTMTVLSARGPSAWSSLDISAPHSHAAHVIESTGNEYQIFSEDLARAAVQPADSTFTPLSAEASEQTPYLRSDFGSPGLCSQSCYRPLVTAMPGYANVPAGTVFGEEPGGVCEAILCGPMFEGASRDLTHVVLSSPVQLTAAPVTAGGSGLYEWAAGHLQLVGVLPEGESGPVVLAGSLRKTLGHYETGVRHAVSDDGERVIMESGETGGDGLYVREVGAGETIRIDAPQGGSGPSGGVSYQTASRDASRVFFLDRGHLTGSSSASGEDLYEYDINASPSARLKDLTADPNAGEAAGVTQVLAASEDGSYVYFVAAGALAPGAVPGAHNLYVSHEGQTGLVAVLSNEDARLYNLTNEGAEYLYARVSPDGRWLAFMSSTGPTGYDTRDAASGTPDAEVYLYDATTSSLVCASCNPTGTRPTGAPIGAIGAGVREFSAAGRVPGWTGPPISFGSSALRQPRYLSDSGRLFFDSPDALIPQDVDGVEDVYEYEPPGLGSCTASSATFVPAAGGCLNLVSAGISPARSELLDASETGGDVFFITQARLAQQDYDTAYDVYDAHECTGASPCYPVTVKPPACQTEASCRTAPTPQPALYGAPASATFSGAGNITPEAPSAMKSKSKPSKALLVAALRACRKKRDRHRRSLCERTARAKYASVGTKSIRRSK